MRPIAQAIPFVSSRWRGEAPLARIFVHEMLVVGTTVNVIAALCAMLLFANEAPNGVAVAVFFAPIPYNVFLLVAVWRSAAHANGSFATVARLVSPAWFVLMAVL